MITLIFSLGCILVSGQPLQGAYPAALGPVADFETPEVPAAGWLGFSSWPADYEWRAIGGPSTATVGIIRDTFAGIESAKGVQHVWVSNRDGDNAKTTKLWFAMPYSVAAEASAIYELTVALRWRAGDAAKEGAAFRFGLATTGDWSYNEPISDEHWLGKRESWEINVTENVWQDFSLVWESDGTLAGETIYVVFERYGSGSGGAGNPRLYIDNIRMRTPTRPEEPMAIAMPFIREFTEVRFIDILDEFSGTSNYEMGPVQIGNSPYADRVSSFEIPETATWMHHNVWPDGYEWETLGAANGAFGVMRSGFEGTPQAPEGNQFLFVSNRDAPEGGTSKIWRRVPHTVPADLSEPYTLTVSLRFPVNTPGLWPAGPTDHGFRLGLATTGGWEDFAPIPAEHWLAKVESSEIEVTAAEWQDFTVTWTPTSDVAGEPIYIVFERFGPGTGGASNPRVYMDQVRLTGPGPVDGLDVKIVSMPAELNGNLGIRTPSIGSVWNEDEIYLAFETDRALTVYVANDRSPAPQWLANYFELMDMTVETTDGVFKIWKRDYAARDFVILQGNGGSIDDNNYWVILSEKPEAVTVRKDDFLAYPMEEWDWRRHHGQVTTDPEGMFHDSSLVSPRVGNFSHEHGFRVSTHFRVPQLQHDGENSIGLVVLGDLMVMEGGTWGMEPEKGIRAEWLPRKADGTSELRLVDHGTGAVLSGAGAAAVWEGEVPTRTSDWTAGDSQIDLIFWDSRSYAEPATYFVGEDKSIVRMPDGLDPGFIMEGIRTVNDLGNSSDAFLQFTVVSGDPSDGNPGTTVFVAWDIRNSGMEPSWLTENFARTDYLVEVSSAARYHRLWAREYGEGELVTLPGASYGGGGPYPSGADNYFVMLGDARPGLETIYRLEAEGSYSGGVWTISATLTDGEGHSETVTGTVAAELAGQNVFGVAVSQPDRTDWSQTPATPIWQVFDLTIDYLNAPELEGFAAWQEQHFDGSELADPGISGAAAAPAGDGVPNLLKYALGVGPYEAVSRENLPRLEVAGGNRILVYTERTDIGDLVYIPEVSDDLTEWRAGPPHLEEVYREGDGFVEEVGVLGTFPAEAGRGFMRLRLEQK